MNFNISEKARTFISSHKEYPVLAGLGVGFYQLAFYYSNNFDLANSWAQLLFFIAYYVLLPITAVSISYQICKRHFKKYVRQSIFVVMLSFFTFYVLQNLGLSYSYKRIFVVVFIVIVALSFKVNNYKPLILLVALMTIFPMYHLAKKIYINHRNTTDWNKQPDGILNCKFKQTPNVYFLQPDGYANVETLRNKLYQFDNSEFEGWLASKGFSIYNNFRSNYSSTLKSNSSCFNMKHHLSKENAGFKNASDYIFDDNPVLKIFKSNGYKTFFIAEKPYLLMSRPTIRFDYCNYSLSEIPFLQDGWSSEKEISNDVKSQILKNKGSKNFFFIEKFRPGHVAVRKSTSLGKEKEREMYIENLKEANVWLTGIVNFITQNDSNAIVIIGADHAGFVGFDATEQAFKKKITDKDLLQSIFGAHLSIKWNNPQHVVYDQNLETSVNLFRTVFSFLSTDTSLLQHFQPDVSYAVYSENGSSGIFKAIE